MQEHVNNFASWKVWPEIHITRNISNIFMDFNRIVPNIFTKNLCGTAARFDNSEQTTNGCCFTRTVCSKITQNFSFVDIESNIFKCLKFTKLLLKSFYFNYLSHNIFLQ